MKLFWKEVLFTNLLVKPFWKEILFPHSLFKPHWKEKPFLKEMWKEILFTNPLLRVLWEASRVDVDIDGDTQVFGHARFIEFKGCAKIA